MPIAKRAGFSQHRDHFLVGWYEVHGSLFHLHSHPGGRIQPIQPLLALYVWNKSRASSVWWRCYCLGNRGDRIGPTCSFTPARD